MTTNELFKEVSSVTKDNLQVVQEKIISLNEEQQKWKPFENTWSIIEIFAHLNKFANYYHETFKKHIQKTKFRTPSENFISSPLGRSAWKSMKLGNLNNVKRKFKAIKHYNPLHEKSLILGRDVEKFTANLNELLEIFEAAKNVNVRKVKIPLSISKIIRLKLGDAFLFVVYHNQRHVQQALNLINHPNFPS